MLIEQQPNHLSAARLQPGDGFPYKLFLLHFDHEVRSSDSGCIRLLLLHCVKLDVSALLSLPLQALVYRNADDPGLQRVDFAQLAQFSIEIQADRLKYVGAIFRGGMILEWNRVDQPLVAFDQRIPRLLVPSQTLAHKMAVAAWRVSL